MKTCLLIIWLGATILGCGSFEAPKTTDGGSGYKLLREIEYPLNVVTNGIAMQIDLDVGEATTVELTSEAGEVLFTKELPSEGTYTLLPTNFGLEGTNNLTLSMRQNSETFDTNFTVEHSAERVKALALEFLNKYTFGDDQIPRYPILDPKIKIGDCDCKTMVESAIKFFNDRTALQLELVDSETFDIEVKKDTEIDSTSWGGLSWGGNEASNGYMAIEESHNDSQRVVTHELGHALGMSHTTDDPNNGANLMDSNASSVILYPHQIHAYNLLYQNGAGTDFSTTIPTLSTESYKAPVGHWTIASDGTITTISGPDLEVIGTPLTPADGGGQTSTGSYLRATHTMAPATNETTINKYSILMDLKIPTAAKIALYNTNVSNSNAGDAFIASDGAIGESHFSANKLATGTWYRVLIAVDLSRRERRYYVNGEEYLLISTGTPAGRFSVDTSQSTRPEILFFADSNGEDGAVIVKRIALFDHALSSSTVTQLGESETAFP